MNKFLLVASVMGMLLNADYTLARQKTNQVKTSEKNVKTLDFTIPTFEINGKPLRKNYRGLDGYAFYKSLVSKREKKKRLEFESEQEYKDRIEKLEINSGIEYAFGLGAWEPKYDVDNQQYSIEVCSKLKRFNCHIASLSFEQTKYVASNAFGASTTVQKTRSHSFILFMDYTNPFFIPDGKDKSTASNMEGDFILPMPIEKAKEFKNKNIGSVLVGRILSPWIEDKTASVTNPTFELPFDSVYNESYLIFSPTKMVIYVLETGEILAIKYPDRTEYKYSKVDKN